MAGSLQAARGASIHLTAHLTEDHAAVLSIFRIGGERRNESGRDRRSSRS